MSRETACSRPFRAVQRVLLGYGIDKLPIEQIYALEVACSVYFPSHINGVIRKCLSGGDVMSKLENAQEQGWDYFAPVVEKMLKGRPVAYINPPLTDDQELPSDDWGTRVYSIVSAAFCSTDFTIQELRILLYDLPWNVFDRETLVEAIAVCRDRGIGSINYLNGVCASRKRDEEARIRKTTGRPWDPPSEESLAEADAAVSSWIDKKEKVDIEEAMRKYEGPSS